MIVVQFVHKSVHVRSIDLVSMYTRIPLDEGLAAFKIALDKRTDKSVPTDNILKLLKMVMEKNIFMFNNKAWLQMLGCSMGSRVSPTYACLFMALLEESMLENCPDTLDMVLNYFTPHSFYALCTIFFKQQLKYK